MKQELLIVVLLIFIPGCSRYLLTETEFEDKKEYKSIPDGLNNPKDVYSLNLHMPDTLPNAILKFKRLNELDLYMPKFNEIPRFVGEFKYLQTLIILDAEIKEVPAEIGDLKNLKWLRLWKMKLTELPPEIGNLRKLEKLELFANDLKELPEEITNLTNLKKIGIDSNENLDFYGAFEKLAQLPNLTYLNINYYPHDKLPSNITKLEYLETITIWNNQSGNLNIDDTIEKLSQFKRLKKVDLTGTPVSARNKNEYIVKLKKLCNDCEIIWNDL